MGVGCAKIVEFTTGGNMSNKTDTLDPEFHNKISSVRLDFLKETGYELAVISCTRTIKEQHALYVESKDGDGIADGITNADGGQSAHNFGLGCDCAPLRGREIWWDAPRSLWDMYGKIAKQYGLVWGGDFKSITDLPHVEDPRWKLKQALWKEGKIEVA